MESHFLKNRIMVGREGGDAGLVDILLLVVKILTVLLQKVWEQTSHLESLILWWTSFMCLNIFCFRLNTKSHNVQGYLSSLWVKLTWFRRLNLVLYDFPHWINKGILLSVWKKILLINIFLRYCHVQYIEYIEKSWKVKG